MCTPSAGQVKTRIPRTHWLASLAESVSPDQHETLSPKNKVDSTWGGIIPKVFALVSIHMYLCMHPHMHTNIQHDWHSFQCNTDWLLALVCYLSVSFYSVMPCDVKKPMSFPLMSVRHSNQSSGMKTRFVGMVSVIEAKERGVRDEWGNHRLVCIRLTLTVLCEAHQN